MKKFLLTLAAAAISFCAMADEGMWMLPYLQKMNIKDMKAKGLKLSAEDIYSIPSIPSESMPSEVLLFVPFSCVMCTSFISLLVLLYCVVVTIH